jgi:hypothetical protein
VINSQKIGHSKGFKLPEIAPIAKAFRAKKWSDLIGCVIDSFSAWNGGVAREVHACATWSPTSHQVDSASEAELDIPFHTKKSKISVWTEMGCDLPRI